MILTHMFSKWEDSKQSSFEKKIQKRRKKEKIAEKRVSR